MKLFQKDVAEILGVQKCTISNWEMNYSEPEVHYIPKIIGFLGYIPFEIGDSVPDKLWGYRLLSGAFKKGSCHKAWRGRINMVEVGRWKS